MSLIFSFNKIYATWNTKVFNFYQIIQPTQHFIRLDAFAPIDIFPHKYWIINFASNINGVNIPSGLKIDETKLIIPRLVTGISFLIGLKTKVSCSIFQEIPKAISIDCNKSSKLTILRESSEGGKELKTLLEVKSHVLE